MREAGASFCKRESEHEKRLMRRSERALGVVFEPVNLLRRCRLAELARLLLGRRLDVLLLLEDGEEGKLLLGRRVIT